MNHVAVMVLPAGISSVDRLTREAARAKIGADGSSEESDVESDRPGTPKAPFGIQYPTGDDVGAGNYGKDGAREKTCFAHATK